MHDDGGFMATQSDIDLYISSWRAMLAELLRWSDDEIQNWLDTKPVDFRNPLMFHEPAAWYIVSLLIPTNVRQELGPRLHAFQAPIVMAMEEAWRSERQDRWQMARSKINDVLKTVNATLP
jgi:hypothetical protein